jgi:hypothetical protein
MYGPLLLDVEVSVGSGPVTATKRINIQASLRQTLKLRGIMVSYSGPNTANPPMNVTINAPTKADLQATAAWSLRVMPVRSRGIFEVASTIGRNSPLDGNVVDGACPASWVSLNAHVALAKFADGNRTDYIYYGLIPINFPNSGNGGGCEAWGVSAGPVGAQIAMTHEIGHSCGLTHGPCGANVGTSADANYPAYEPYDTPTMRVASIGEFGLDISTGAIRTPNVFRDYMSYCAPPWVSLYNYANLINNPALNPETVGTLPRWWEEGHPLYDPWWFLDYNPGYPPPRWVASAPRPEFKMPRVIAITATRDKVGRVAVTHIVRTEVFSATVPGVATELVAQLLDANGAILASAPLRASASQAGNCCACGRSDDGARLDLLSALLPDEAPGAALVIKQGDATLWERRAPVRPVQVRDLRAKRWRDGLVQITWKADWPDRAGGHCWIRYSTDRGRSWKSVAVDVRGESTTTDASNLPAGRILLQVSGHDGFYSVHSKPLAFLNESRPPSLAILHPYPGRSLVAGETLHLWGSASGQPGSSPEDDLYFKWEIDGRKVGDELEMFAAVPSPGRHRAKLVCTSRSGRAIATAEVKFEAVSRRAGRSAKRPRTRR